jgi:hypothetical protein
MVLHTGSQLTEQKEDKEGVKSNRTERRRGKYDEGRNIGNYEED